VLEQAWRSFATPEAYTRALVSRITCSVLFAWAARDRFVQLGRSLPAIRQFPNARLEKFPAGHAVHLEMPEAFEALRALPRRDGSSGTKPGAPGVAGPRL